jgi:hypothetical protein
MHELALHYLPSESQALPKVRVEYRSQPRAQPQSAEADLNFTYKPEDRQLIQWYLEEYLLCPWGVFRERAQKAENTIRQLGMDLFDAVFSTVEQQKLYYRVSDQLPDTRIVIHAPTTAGASLPWEFLYDQSRKDFGALSRHAYSFSRSQPNLPLPSTTPSDKGPLSILLVICRPSGPDEDVPFQSVARPLVEMFNRDEMKDRVQLTVLRPATFSQLAKELLHNKGKYHILHFDGHGTYPNVPPGLAIPQFYNHPGIQGHLLFENEDPYSDKGRLITGSELGNVLVQAQVPVVLLNACQSGKTQEASPYHSVGNQLLSAGACGVVAMAYSVFVHSAKRFMRQLYEELLNGEELGRSVSLAREELINDPKRPSPIGPLALHDWMVPIILQTSDVILTKKPKSKIHLKLEDTSPHAAGKEIDCPPPPTYGLVGRDSIMLELERAFLTETIVLLQGMAGIGKTECAMGFARWLANTGGLDGPVLFLKFEFHLPLIRVIDRIGRPFAPLVKQQTRCRISDWKPIRLDSRRTS